MNEERRKFLQYLAGGAIGVIGAGIWTDLLFNDARYLEKLVGSKPTEIYVLKTYQGIFAEYHKRVYEIQFGSPPPFRGIDQANSLVNERKLNKAEIEIATALTTQLHGRIDCENLPDYEIIKFPYETGRSLGNVYTNTKYPLVKLKPEMGSLESLLQR